MKIIIYYFSYLKYYNRLYIIFVFLYFVIKLILNNSLHKNINFIT